MQIHWPVVLMYHGVIPKTPDHNPVDLGVVFQDEFECQLKRLKKSFFVLHPDEFIDYFIRGLPYPKSSVLITIDDGYQNILDFALPVAESYELPILAFVATGHVGDDKWLWFSRIKAGQLRNTDPSVPTVQSLEMLAISEIEAVLDDAGAPQFGNGNNFEHMMFDGMDRARLANAAKSKYFTIGGHTIRHPRLVNETPEVRTYEIIENKRTLEEIVSKPVNCFAYPQGIHNDTVIQDVRRAGYLAAFACEFPQETVLSDAEQFIIPRTGVYRPGGFWFWYVSHPIGRFIKAAKHDLFG